MVIPPDSALSVSIKKQSPCREKGNTGHAHVEIFYVLRYQDAAELRDLFDRSEQSSRPYFLKNP